MSEKKSGPPRIEGKAIKFKKEKKKDKLKKLLGDNLMGVMRSGDELTIFIKEDVDLSQSDIDKIQRIVDGE